MQDGAEAMNYLKRLSDNLMTMNLEHRLVIVASCATHEVRNYKKVKAVMSKNNFMMEIPLGLLA